MLRVVLDTNTVVSGAIGGVSARIIYLLTKEKAFQVIVSYDIMQEYEEVLCRPHFGFQTKLVTALLDFFKVNALWVKPQGITRVIAADPDDDKFLAAAVEGCANYIVSGDKHLLSLGSFEGIHILNSSQFLQVIRTTES